MARPECRSHSVPPGRSSPSTTSTSIGGSDTEGCSVAYSIQRMWALISRVDAIECKISFCILMRIGVPWSPGFVRCSTVRLIANSKQSFSPKELSVPPGGYCGNQKQFFTKIIFNTLRTEPGSVEMTLGPCATMVVPQFRSTGMRRRWGYCGVEL